jgi:hypothetical protein
MWFLQAQHDIGQGKRADPRLPRGDEWTCHVRNVPNAFILSCSREVRGRYQSCWSYWVSMTDGHLVVARSLRRWLVARSSLVISGLSLWRLYRMPALGLGVK